MDSTGKTLVDAGRHFRSARARQREFVEALTNGEFVTIRPDENLGEYMLFSSRKVGNYVVRLAIPYRQARKAMCTVVMALIVAASAGLFTVLAAFLTIRRFRRRIAALANEKLAQSRRLAEAERMERFRREFLENVSHEVKTPIAAVKCAVEMLGDDVELPEKERKSLLNVAFKESGRVQTLVDDLLNLAKLESAEQAHAPFSPFDLGLVVRTVVKDYETLAAKSGVKILTRCSEGIEVCGDSGKFEMAVGNLLLNALKYGAGSDISVSLAREGARAVLRVEDHGIGIPPEHIDRIFERFYRVDKARSREAG